MAVSLNGRGALSLIEDSLRVVAGAALVSLQAIKGNFHGPIQWSYGGTYGNLENRHEKPSLKSKSEERPQTDSERKATSNDKNRTSKANPDVNLPETLQAPVICQDDSLLDTSSAPKGQVMRPNVEFKPRERNVPSTQFGRVLG